MMNGLAWSYLLLLVVLLPTVWTVKCNDLVAADGDNAKDVYAACVDETKLGRVAGNVVNLKLGGLTEAEINKFLSSKTDIQVGLDFSDSEATKIVFGDCKVTLEDNNFIVFANNPNLKEIDLRKVSEWLMGSTIAKNQVLRVVNNQKLTALDLASDLKTDFNLMVRGNQLLKPVALERLKGFFAGKKDITSKSGECYFPAPIDSLETLDKANCTFIYNDLKFAQDATGDSWTKPGIPIEDGCVIMENTKIKTLAFLDKNIQCTPIITNNEDLCDFSPFTDSTTFTVDSGTNCPHLCKTKNQLLTKTTCTVVDVDANFGVFDQHDAAARAALERIEEIHGAIVVTGQKGGILSLKIKKMTAGAAPPKLTILFSSLAGITFAGKVEVVPSTTAAVFDFKDAGFTWTEDQLNEAINITGLRKDQFVYAALTTTTRTSTTKKTTTSSTTPSTNQAAGGSVPGGAGPGSVPSTGPNVPGSPASGSQASSNTTDQLQAKRAARRAQLQKEHDDTERLLYLGALGFAIFMIIFFGSWGLGLWFWSADLRKDRAEALKKQKKNQKAEKQATTFTCKIEHQKTRNTQQRTRAIKFTKDDKKMMQDALCERLRFPTKNRIGKMSFAKSPGWTPELIKKFRDEYFSDFFDKKTTPINGAKYRNEKFDKIAQETFGFDDRFGCMQRCLENTKEYLRYPNIGNLKSPSEAHPGGVGRMVWPCAVMEGNECEVRKAKRAPKQGTVLINVYMPYEKFMEDRLRNERKNSDRWRGLKERYLTDKNISKRHISLKDWKFDLEALDYVVDQVYAIQYYNCAEAKQFATKQPCYRPKKDKSYWDDVELARMHYTIKLAYFFDKARWINMEEQLPAEHNTSVKVNAEIKAMCDEMNWLSDITDRILAFVKSKGADYIPVARHDEGKIELVWMTEDDLEHKEQLYDRIYEKTLYRILPLSVTDERQRQHLANARAFWLDFWSEFVVQFENIRNRRKKKGEFVVKRAERLEAFAYWMQVLDLDWVPFFLCPVEYQVCVAQKVDKIDEETIQFGPKSYNGHQFLVKYHNAIDDLQDAAYELQFMMRDLLTGHFHSLHIPEEFQFFMLFAKKLRTEYLPFLCFNEEPAYKADVKVYWDMLDNPEEIQKATEKQKLEGKKKLDVLKPRNSPGKMRKSPSRSGAPAAPLLKKRSPKK